MKKSASYILSSYSFISTDALENLLSVGNTLKNGNPIPSFDENLLINLCSETQQILAKENNLLKLSGDFIIVGDIHGSFHDLLRILNFVKINNSKVLFLGDYVDRGCFSLECITILFALKVMHPDTFFLIRGNHEFDTMCNKYGFKSEIVSIKKSQSLIIPRKSNEVDQLNNYDEHHNIMYCYRYSDRLYRAFIRTFSYLPIAAIINNSNFCIHGGLSPKLDHIDEIENLIIRPIHNIESNDLLSDLIWSDPSYGSNCLFDENPRGRGYLFNDESVFNFLRKNSLLRMIRAHQCVINGYLLSAGEKCITIFSASSYDVVMDNKSAVLQLFQKDDAFKITTFPPLKRLQKCEAFYYKVQSLDFKETSIRSCFSLHHPSLLTSGIVKIFTNINSNANPEKLTATKRVKNMSQLSKSKFITNRRKSPNISLSPIFNDEPENDNTDDKGPPTIT